MFFPGVYGGGGGLSNGAISRRNLIINGAMTVAQKGTIVTDILPGGYYTVDRFLIDKSGTFTLTDEQSTDAPEGFSFSKKITHTGANVTLSASHYLIPFETRLEGQDFQHLKYGTANAETVTVSFWFRTNKIGTYVCEIDSYSELNTRYVISQSFTVTDVNWNKYEFTFPGNTLDNIRNNNQKGFGFVIWAAASSTYTSGGTLNSSWNLETSVTNKRAFGVSDTLNTNEFWACTGVQVELGDKATPFEYRPYVLELSLCQRYLQKFGSASSGGRIATGQAHAIGQARVCLPYQKPMRATPTLIISAASDFALTKANETTLGATTLSLANTGVNSCTLTVFCSPAELVAGDATQLITLGTDKYFYLSARL